MKIALLNHGCAKNLVDSELMLGLLSEAGYKITLDENEADIIIVNTCGFIHDAEQESVQTILTLISQNKKVIITGCLSQKYKKDLAQEIPEALAVIGISELGNIVEIVKKIENSNNTICDVAQTPVYTYPENVQRVHITMGASSYLKIADGCNFQCGYCIIPSLRGKYVSRPYERIIEEARQLANKGVREIILIAQDTTSWGIDIYGEPSLHKLLKGLNEIENLDWIRIMYTYPSLVTDELLETMANCEKVIKYIDIPLQHSHPEVLKRMCRPVFDYKLLINKIRRYMPEIAIRTTFIVGYPQESDEEFLHLYDFIKDMKFDKLGVFEFCSEKGTYAYKLRGKVSAKIKKERKKKLMLLQQQISKEINQSFIGKEIPVIVETIIDGTNNVEARSFRDAPEIDGIVKIATEKDILPTDIIKVSICDADEYDMYATY